MILTSFAHTHSHPFLPTPFAQDCLSAYPCLAAGIAQCLLPSDPFAVTVFQLETLVENDVFKQ
jgi:hypothetical protein